MASSENDQELSVEIETYPHHGENSNSLSANCAGQPLGTDAITEIERLEKIILHFSIEKTTNDIDWSVFCGRVHLLRALLHEGELLLRTNKLGKAASKLHDAYVLVQHRYIYTSQKIYPEKQDSLRLIYSLQSRILERAIVANILLKKNNTAMRMSDNAVTMNPYCPFHFIWRSILFRRLGMFSRAIKCLTMKWKIGKTIKRRMYWHTGPVLTNYEEDVVSLYYKEVFSNMLAQSEHMRTIYAKQKSIAPKPSESADIAAQFIQQFPKFHCTMLINRKHAHPPTSDGRVIQMIGFDDDMEKFSVNYVMRPDFIGNVVMKGLLSYTTEDKILVVDEMMLTRKIVEIIQSTNPEAKLEFGFGLWERLICATILCFKNDFDTALEEYRFLLTELLLYATFAKSSDLKADTERHLMYVEVVQMVISKLEAKVEGRTESNKVISRMEQLLHHWTRKWMLKRKQKRRLLKSAKKKLKKNSKLKWKINHRLAARKLKFKKTVTIKEETTNFL